MNDFYKLNNFLNDAKSQAHANYNTQILLQSSNLLSNLKQSFFEQELWRFLKYYPSGGKLNTLIKSHSLFGINSKESMLEMLEKYMNSEMNKNESNILNENSGLLNIPIYNNKSASISFDSKTKCFIANPRLALNDQILLFHESKQNMLTQLKSFANEIKESIKVAMNENECEIKFGENDFEMLKILNSEYSRLWNECNQSNCRIFYSFDLFENIFFEWGNETLRLKQLLLRNGKETKHNLKNIGPNFEAFQKTCMQIMQEYQHALNPDKKKNERRNESKKNSVLQQKQITLSDFCSLSIYLIFVNCCFAKTFSLCV